MSPSLTSGAVAQEIDSPPASRWRRLARQLWMGNLLGRWIGLMLVTLIVFQIVVMVIYRSAADDALSAAREKDFIGRTAALSRVLASTNESLHATMLQAANTTSARYWTSDAGLVDPATWQTVALRHLLTPRATGHAAPSHAERLQIDQRAQWVPIDSTEIDDGRPAYLMRLPDWDGFGIVMPLDTSRWVSVAFAKSPAVTSDLIPFVSVSLLLAALLLSLVSVVAVHWIGRPLRRLTTALNRLGRNEMVDPLPETGPDDLRDASVAFNQTQGRIHSFVKDRTLMLAAISHDLRTPITAMRLRVEFIQDPAIRQQLVRTLDEMRAMTDATLAFAREEGREEPPRVVDLAALVGSVCDDLTDLGWDVSHGNRIGFPVRCRPAGLTRVLRNLIENAVRYGERARVFIDELPGRVQITIDDDGPGIPVSEHERVFAPFVRLEESRNRSTGGVGLGLSIARTLMRSQGGEVTIANRPERGMRACIIIPNPDDLRLDHERARPEARALPMHRPEDSCGMPKAWT